jgi:hypothetical protein
MKLLTLGYHIAILFLLSKKTKVGPSTPENQGHRRPLSKVVFLCPSKTLAALCRFDSVMAGCVGLPLKRRAGSLTGVENPMQSATQYFSILSGGLSLSQGITAMLKSTQTTAKSSQYKQSLFSVYHNQNLIAFNVPGVLAFRLKQRKPTAILKFSRFGAVQ